MYRSFKLGRFTFYFSAATRIGIGTQFVIEDVFYALDFALGCFEFGIEYARSN